MGDWGGGCCSGGVGCSCGVGGTGSPFTQMLHTDANDTKDATLVRNCWCRIVELTTLQGRRVSHFLVGMYADETTQSREGRFWSSWSQTLCSCKTPTRKNSSHGRLRTKSTGEVYHSTFSTKARGAVILLRKGVPFVQKKTIAKKKVDTR